jgi:hypothetical protein
LITKTSIEAKYKYHNRYSSSPFSIWQSVVRIISTVTNLTLLRRKMISINWFVEARDWWWKQNGMSS